MTLTIFIIITVIIGLLAQLSTLLIEGKIFPTKVEPDYQWTFGFYIPFIGTILAIVLILFTIIISFIYIFEDEDPEQELIRLKREKNKMQEEKIKEEIEKKNKIEAKENAKKVLKEIEIIKREIYDL